MLLCMRRVVPLGLFAALLALAAGVGLPAASGLAERIRAALDADEIRAAPRAVEPDGPDVTPPVGLERGSLLLRGNLAPALRDLRRRAGGEIRSLRIAPDRIALVVATTSGRVRAFERTWDGETAMLSDTDAAKAPALPTVAWAQVDPSAPRRIARRMIAGGRPSRAIDVLTLSAAGGTRWTAYLTDATGFVASLDGRSVRRS